MTFFDRADSVLDIGNFVKIALITVTVLAVGAVGALVYFFATYHH